MQKKLLFLYLGLCALIFVALATAKISQEWVRGGAFFLSGPIFEGFLRGKEKALHPSELSSFSSFTIKEKLEQLKNENLLLEERVHFLETLFVEQLNVSGLENLPIPARVVFRSLDYWNRSVWINLGTSANKDPDNPVIAKGSPAIVGQSIVGVVDLVGRHYSRIRLVSDPMLNPSVRVCRGGEKLKFLHFCLSELSDQVAFLSEVAIDDKKKKAAISTIEELKESLNQDQKGLFLAKGELLGMVNPSRESKEVILKGTGFNSDFSKIDGSPSTSVIQEGDLLVTTGMDGVFPPGFHVARVTKVNPLEEGDFFYSIEARPTAFALKELSLIFILPPYTSTELQELITKESN